MAIDKLQPTAEKGVFYRTEPGRKNGVKLDRQFVIVYKLGGKKYRGVLGWESVGHRVSEARDKIEVFKRNFKAGDGPLSLEDERESAQRERIAREEAERVRLEAERNRPTIAVLWKKYIEANPGMKGVVQDRNRFDHYLRDAFGDKLPGEIVPLDLDRLRLGMLRGKIGPAKKVKEEGKIKEVRTPKSPQTVKHVLVLLRRIIRFGVQRKLCPPPDLTFNMPEVDNQVTEHLTDEQVKHLLIALDNERDRQAVAVVKLALHTGMRRGELLSLQWKHVDLERRTVRIDNPKGGKSQTLPISDAAVAVLKEIEKQRDTAKRSKAPDGETGTSPSDLVFPGRNGKRRSDLKRPLDRIRTAAGLPEGFRPLHGLRHHFASTLASSGEVDLYTLQKLLTHKDPATTQRYAHLRDETLRSAADVAARALEKAKGAGGAEGESKAEGE